VEEEEGGVGNIYTLADGSIQYQVSSVKELGVIIDHFDKYPLLTIKQEDYLLFKEAFNLIKNKEHLTVEGLNKILSIRASINKGLSLQLKAAFSAVKPAPLPTVELKGVLTYDWLVGFVDVPPLPSGVGVAKQQEGCFLVNIQNSPTHRLRCKVELRFQVTQHYRDILLMESLVGYLDCGKVFRTR
jgi:hypothetical protein